MNHFHIPALPEYYLDRERIRCRLDKNTGVCFLTGRQGCGKTSALAQFFKGKEKEVFWYSFQKEDNQETVFQKNLKHAAEERFLKQPGETASGILHSLLNYPNISYFVFDCLQVLSNEKILCALREFLEESAGRRKIFLSGSDKPAPCFSRFLASGIYEMISGGEFSFTLEEAGELFGMYLKEQYGRQAQTECAAHLMKLTGGWPAAVSFLLRFVSSQGMRMESFLGLRPVDVLLDTMLYDYIDYEIYGRFSAKEKRMLAQMAEFRNLDSDMIRYCLGHDVRSGILRKLRGRNLLFRTDRAGEEEEQYEPLLRLFLREQTTQEEKKKIRQQAGAYYLKEEAFAEAFYYIEDNPDAVRSMLLRYGRKIMQQELYGLMGQCLFLLEQEPSDWSAKELGLAAEYYYRTGDRPHMEACLNAADSMFGKENQYGMYRSLYRGLFHYEENPAKYKELVNSVLFFLEENKIPFPYLKDSEQQMLRKIRTEKKDSRAAGGIKIKVSAFGTFRAVILASGKELPWRTKKGCELFAYLLELDGEPVERKTLLSQLWKEEIPNNAVAMLHNMIYNIRKELSYYSMENMIQYKNKKYVMHTEMIQSDLEQVRMAAACVEKKDTAGLMRLKSLFDTPWGLYLEDLDNVWVRERQEYYQKIFEKGCLMIGEACAGQDGYEQAAVYFKNALAVNCYSEKIMAMLLKCYGQTGQLGSAKKQYQEFCVLLRKELDIAPGDELQDSYRACVLCGSRA